MSHCPSTTPTCYGHLFDHRVETCQACLLNSDCKDAMKRPKLAIGEDIPTDGSEDKKLLILMICKKFGLETSFQSRSDKRRYDVTEENRDQFYNLDLLITNVLSLKKLLNTELAKDTY